MYKIVVIDDEKPIRDSLKGVLEDEGYTVYTAEDGMIGVRLIREVIPDVVLLDIWMPGKDGVEVLKDIKEELPQIPVIIMSGHGTIETAVKTTKIGAYDFLEKPISLDRLMLLIQNAINFHNLLYENIYLKEQIKSDDVIIAESPQMKRVVNEINALLSTKIAIVLVGEEGTGKEFLAKYIHRLSSYKTGKFVEINCLKQQKLTNIKENISLAYNGTLYVKDFQKLTQEILQEILNHYKDFRIILSCVELNNAPQNPSIKLIHNINNAILNIPPLRERKEDIKPLLQHFSEVFSEHYGKKLSFTQQAIGILEKYCWPGNIKELKNLVEQMYITSKTTTILQKDLPEHILINCQQSTLQQELFHHNLLKEARKVFEREFIKHKLIETSGNIKKASEIMGISEKNLNKLINCFKLQDYVR